MPGSQESVQLPDELLLYIAKYFDGDEDGLSLAISEAVPLRRNFYFFVGTLNIKD